RYLVRRAAHRARADAERLRDLFDAGDDLVDGQLEGADRGIEHLAPGFGGIDGRVLVQRHRGGDVEADRLGDELGPGDGPLGREARVPSQRIHHGAQHHVAGDHAGARGDADLVFLLAQRAAGFDITLAELAAEQQRVMLLLHAADALAMAWNIDAT